ncbi:hypothetical protein JTB14_033472 [Gonioctena quinquepunctata]|nr:hypothetical protein JTB14_033472 [Gonioctena quinquepunctata]
MNADDSNNQNNSDSNKKPARVPPITLRDKSKWLTLRKLINDNDIKVIKSHNIVDGISIHLDSPDAYRKLHKIMQTHSIPHHVYTLQEDKPLRVVFRHVPTEFSDSDIVEDLRDQVSRIFPLPECKTDKSAMPMVLVNMQKRKKKYF